MTTDTTPAPQAPEPPKGWVGKALDWIEWAGNKLPDPAMLFVIALLITWVLSAALAPLDFGEDDPKSVGDVARGKLKEPEPLRVRSQVTGDALAGFLANMVDTFVRFPPLGVVLVA